MNPRFFSRLKQPACLETIYFLSVVLNEEIYGSFAVVALNLEVLWGFRFSQSDDSLRWSAFSEIVNLSGMSEGAHLWGLDWFYCSIASLIGRLNLHST